MIRLFAIVSLFALTIAGLLAPLTSIHPGTVVIGGEYTVEPGEVRHGDMIVLFARVKIAAGGEVTGQIRAFASDLDIAGSVAESIRVFGSKLTVDSTAKVTRDAQSMDTLPDGILLPSILLVVS